MKKLLSLAVCLCLLLTVVFMMSCTQHDNDDDTTNYTNPSLDHYDDLPPNWAPAARLPDDAIIYNNETGIPDVALYIAVLRAIDRDRMRHFAATGEGTFTAGEAAAVTSIRILPLGHSSDSEDFERDNLGWHPPRNLRGIEHLRNLEEVDMTINRDFGRPGGLDSINELRRLEHLPHLRTFIFFDAYLGENVRSPLRNLLPMRNLTELTTLEIYSEHLTSLEGIQNLIGITSLEITGVFTSLNGMQNLTGITRLQIAGSLTSLDGIQNLTNLEELRFWGHLPNLRGIERLTNLRILDVSRNELTNLNGVQNLVNLIRIAASGNQLTDISAVAYLPNLQVLDVRRNQLERLPDFTASSLAEYIREYGARRSTSFSGNRLSREQFERNLPASLLENQRWLEQEIRWQQ